MPMRVLMPAAAARRRSAQSAELSMLAPSDSVITDAQRAHMATDSSVCMLLRWCSLRRPLENVADRSFRPGRTSRTRDATSIERSGNSTQCRDTAGRVARIRQMPAVRRASRLRRHAVLESKQRTKIGIADADRVGQHGLKSQVQPRAAGFSLEFRRTVARSRSRSPR